MRRTFSTRTCWLLPVCVGLRPYVQRVSKAFAIRLFPKLPHLSASDLPLLSISSAPGHVPEGSFDAPRLSRRHGDDRDAWLPTRLRPRSTISWTVPLCGIAAPRWRLTLSAKPSTIGWHGRCIRDGRVRREHEGWRECRCWRRNVAIPTAWRGRPVVRRREIRDAPRHGPRVEWTGG